MSNSAGDLIEELFSWSELEENELLIIPIRRQMVVHQQILLNLGSELMIQGEVVIV